ncbi:MAG TPA: hypothetical protein VFU81_16845, partial [Thermomicrobiales bacterium]|nr:hypothetical protein [Thermomicrobiales bacterium]
MVTTTNRGQWISREARAMACRRAASGHRGAALRALMPPLTILLLVVTVVALLVTAVSLAPLIPPAPPAAAANADLARRFYAAANAILADADPALLAALVAPGFADHEPGGSTLDRAGLIIRLGEIARAVPGAQLKVGTI